MRERERECERKREREKERERERERERHTPELYSLYPYFANTMRILSHKDPKFLCIVCSLSFVLGIGLDYR